MTWSVIKHEDGDRIVRLDLLGDLRGTAMEPLRSMLVQLLRSDLPDELVVGLHAVSALNVATVTALMSGYISAVEYGTSYRVVGAHGGVRNVLQHTGMLDVLADNNDLGALLLAVLLSPPARSC